MEHDLVPEDYMEQAYALIRSMTLREIQSDHPDQESGNSPLHNFSRAFKGAGDGIPAAYAQECIDLEKRQQQKANNQSTVANVYSFLDEYGNLTQQSDRNHFFIPAAYVDAYIAGLVALRNAPDVPTDGNQPMNVPGQMSSKLPMTNKQLSQIQNELTLRAIKKSR